MQWYSFQPPLVDWFFNWCRAHCSLTLRPLWFASPIAIQGHELSRYREEDWSSKMNPELLWKSHSIPSKIAWPSPYLLMWQGFWDPTITINQVMVGCQLIPKSFHFGVVDGDGLEALSLLHDLLADLIDSWVIPLWKYIIDIVPRVDCNFYSFGFDTM